MEYYQDVSRAMIVRWVSAASARAKDADNSEYTPMARERAQDNFTRALGCLSAWDAENYDAAIDAWNGYTK